MDPFDLMDRWGPEKIVNVQDSHTGMQGVLVIDNTARGMGKGGTRMAPQLSTVEVARLARTMTWKWAIADLYFGGAKAGIRADPHSTRKEEVLRAFVRALRNEVPREYVLGLDVGLDERDAAVVQDELGDRGAAIGTPPELGGVAYDQLGLTGLGVAQAAAVACELAGLNASETSVSIQGFGAVGSATAKRLSEIGATVVAISTASGALYAEDGLDVNHLLELREQCGDDLVNYYAGGQRLGLGQELRVRCDVLVPAALQDVIDAQTASELTAAVVVEGANLPTSPEAQQVLKRRGVLVVPDVVANAGGVVAGAFAMDARFSPFPPDVDRIRETVISKIEGNTRMILERARDEEATTHELAWKIGAERVEAAMRLKGRFAAA